MLLALLLACSTPEPAPKPAAAPVAAPAALPSEPVDRAVTLARRIAAEPERADAILAEYRLDRAALDALLYDIAADPRLSRRYAEAMGR